VRPSYIYDSCIQDVSGREQNGSYTCIQNMNAKKKTPDLEAFVDLNKKYLVSLGIGIELCLDNGMSLAFILVAPDGIGVFPILDFLIVL